MVTRRYRFSASHRLHSNALSEERNEALYGKCNNPFGHGHNYELDVSVRGPVDPVTGRAIDGGKLDRLVQAEVVEPLHHRSLNVEIPAFAEAVPTTENLGLEIYGRLKQRWEDTFPGPWPALDKIRISETPRNIFEVVSENAKD